jgi:integrase
VWRLFRNRNSRHTFAVELLKHGVPIETVSMLLGHASIRVTEKHYDEGLAQVITQKTACPIARSLRQGIDYAKTRVRRVSTR